MDYVKYVYVRSSELGVKYLLIGEVFGAVKAQRAYKVTISVRECYWKVVYWYYSENDSTKILWTMSSVVFPWKLFGQWILLPSTIPNKVRIF